MEGYTREVRINKNYVDDLKDVIDVLLADSAKYYEMAHRDDDENAEDKSNDFKLEMSRTFQFFKKQQSENRDLINTSSELAFKAQRVRDIMIKAYQVINRALKKENNEEKDMTRTLEELLKNGTECKFIKKLEEVEELYRDQVPKDSYDDLKEKYEALVK